MFPDIIFLRIDVKETEARWIMCIVKSTFISVVNTGFPRYLQEIGTEKICSHTTNSHIKRKRQRMAIKSMIGSWKMTNAQSHNGKLQTKGPHITRAVVTVKPFKTIYVSESKKEASTFARLMVLATFKAAECLPMWK